MPPPPSPKPSGVSVAAASLLQARKSAQPPPLLLNIQELERFENLLVFAQATVEGYYAGKHKSPYRGAAAEFADYKEYAPGDDLARLDWRGVWGTGRLGMRPGSGGTGMTGDLPPGIHGWVGVGGEKG